jgi:hypothetical protein
MGFDLKSTALFAVLGSIGVMWGQIRAFFAYISSYVIVTVKIDDSTAWNILVEHCRTQYKESRFGQKNYSTIQEYIRPKGRYGHIAQANTPQRTLFFKGCLPLFMGMTKSDNNSGGTNLQLTYIRGTFDIEEMLVSAVEKYDEENHAKDSARRRFYVKKVFGKAVSNDRDGDSDSKAFATDAPISASAWLGRRPLKWKPEEIGSPVSQVPFQNLAYTDEVKEFKTEIVRWKNSEKWFKEKSIPWRMGGGLFGPPGTGKTSFVRAVGQELDLPIHVYDLTTMSNEELTLFWRRSLNAAPCIVLFEDLDRVFDEERNVKGTMGKAPLTLDCLLNCINGVDPADGILVLVTANDVSKLDPALGVPDETGKSTRPGRLDRVVNFGPLNESGRREVAKRIFADCPEEIETQVAEGAGETGAQFENRCSKLALARYWGKNGT